MIPSRTCPICNGAGRTYPTPSATQAQTCRDCEGRGVVLAHRDTPRIMIVTTSAWFDTLTELDRLRHRVTQLEADAARKGRLKARAS